MANSMRTARSTKDASNNHQPYKKTPGSANKACEDYKIKMAALQYIRAVNSRQEFAMATNMAAADKFDDIVLRIRNIGQDKWTMTLIQLKHKVNYEKVNYAQLFSLVKNSDLALVKYNDSFHKIKKSFSEQNDLNFNTSFDDIMCIVYTNATSYEVLQDDNESMVDVDGILRTTADGATFCFKNTSRVYQGIREIVEFKELLIKLLDDTDGVDKENSGQVIKTNAAELKVSTFNPELGLKRNILLGNPDREQVKKVLQELSLVGDLASYSEFFSKLHFCTNQANVEQLDSLIKLEICKALNIPDESDVEAEFTEICSQIQKWWRDQETIWLTEQSPIWSDIVSSRIDKLSQGKKIASEKGTVQFTEESAKRLFKDIINYKIVNLVGKEGTTTLIVSKVWQALRDERHIFVGLKDLVSRREELLSAWRNSLCDGLVVDCDEQINDDDATELVGELNNLILNNTHLRCVLVSTEHNNVSTSLMLRVAGMVTIEENCSWRDLTTESQSKLEKSQVIFQGYKMPLKEVIREQRQLETLIKGTTFADLANEEYRIGQDLEELMDYYIPRSLLSIAIIDSVADRTVLVIAEPGMGKSTLVTHLAQACKQADPSTWVVRINLNDTTKYLARLKDRQVDKATAVEFIINFAEVKGSDLEASLLRERLLSTGKIVVYIDGVDKVCPLHEYTVSRLLKCLLETKIVKLWVTSRFVAQKSLEKSLNVHSFALERFSSADRRQFFSKYWRSKFPNDDEALQEFVNRVMERIESSFLDDNIIATPLQTLMLAEYYDRNIKKNEPGRNRIEPEKIDLLELFKSFVSKKLIHFSEKKNDNLENSAEQSDNKVLHDFFLENLISSSLSVKKKENPTHMIHIAIEHGRLDVIKYLREQGADLALSRYGGLWIPLHTASEHGHLDVLKYLHEQGADLSITSDYHMNMSIHTASEHGQLDVIKYLHQQGIDLSVKNLAGWMPLHIASQHGKLDVIKYLHEQGVDLSVKSDGHDLIARSKKGWMPLHMASQHGRLDVIKYLHQQGVDLSAKLNNGWMPLHIASLNGKLDVIKYLHQQGQPDLSVKVDGGWTSLHIASWTGQLDVIKYLHEQGADLSVRSDGGWTPIHQATCYRRLDVVKYLHEQGVDLLVKNNAGWMPLQCASQHGALDVIKYLHEQGVDLSVKNNKGWMPIHIATQYGQSHVVEYLIDQGVDVSAKTNDGRTPLHIASMYDMPCIVKRLHELGADPKAVTNDGKRPVDWASVYGPRYGNKLCRFEITEYLTPFS